MAAGPPGSVSKKLRRGRIRHWRWQLRRPHHKSGHSTAGTRQCAKATWMLAVPRVTGHNELKKVCGVQGVGLREPILPRPPFLNHNSVCVLSLYPCQRQQTISQSHARARACTHTHTLSSKTMSQVPPQSSLLPGCRLLIPTGKQSLDGTL